MRGGPVRGGGGVAPWIKPEVRPDRNLALQIPTRDSKTAHMSYTPDRNSRRRCADSLKSPNLSARHLPCAKSLGRKPRHARRSVSSVSSGLMPMRIGSAVVPRPRLT